MGLDASEPTSGVAWLAMLVMTTSGGPYSNVVLAAGLALDSSGL